MLVAHGDIEHSSELRSALLSRMLIAYGNEDARLPKRLTCAIPLTYPLLLECFIAIDSIFAKDVALCLCLKAAFALGYSLSLRPGEYLHQPRPIALNHTANSSTSYFWWDATAYVATSPQLFPSGLPTAFSLYLDFRKNDPRGTGGPLAVARDPTLMPPPTVDCVSAIFNYIHKFPPLPLTPLLSGGLSTNRAKNSDIVEVLNVVAQKFGLPAERMRARCLRSGVLAQIEDMDDHVKLQQGGWRSVSGMLFYTRGSLNHAKRICRSIHDPTICPISESQFMFTSPTLHSPPL